MKLLNIDANAKTVKGQKNGFMTAVLYLAPANASGYNVCPMAKQAGCIDGCLNTAGRGGIAKAGATMDTPAGALPDNAIQRARIARTRFYFEDRDGFIAQLEREIDAFLRKAARKGLTPVIRLNGTSDLEWERRHPELFEKYADVQFYDYTKVYTRFKRERPSNYHLSLSYSEACPKYKQACHKARAEHNVSLIAVMRSAKQVDAARNVDHRFVDGDAHDLRFLDPEGANVYLKAKGRARQDQSGFVID